MDLVFIDANVLVSPVPRTMVYQTAAYAEPGFLPIYSPFVETQAERHQRPGHIRVSELRARLDWHLCPDANPEQFDFVDTSQADRPILAAAISSEAKFIITSDVDDFGNTDLRRYGISAVNPGLFLAARVTPDIYTDTLYEIAARRQREPRTATSIHNLEIAVELDVLFRRFQTIFGPTTSPSPHNPPRTLFKGAVCIQCKQTLTKAENGLHQDCRWQDWVGK